MTKADDNALLHNKIRELEEDVARGKSQFMRLHYAAMAEYSAIRADERRKVAEEIAEFVEKEEVACVGVLWPEEDAELTLKKVAAAIRAKYLTPDAG